MSDRDRKILLALIPFVVLVAYWFLLLAPKRDEAIHGLGPGREAGAAARRGQAEAAQAATAPRPNFAADYTEIVRLGKAIPAQVDMPSLLVQLDARPPGTGIRFTKIATGRARPRSPRPPPRRARRPPAGSESGTTARPCRGRRRRPRQSAPGQAAEARQQRAATANQSRRGASSRRQPLATRRPPRRRRAAGDGRPPPPAPTAAAAPVGLETVPLELEFVGDFFNLADFFHGVKRFVHVANSNVIVSGRLVTIDSVSCASDHGSSRASGPRSRRPSTCRRRRRARPPARPRRVRLPTTPATTPAATPAPAATHSRLPRPPPRPHGTP